jgi:hypothetical protein
MKKKIFKIIALVVAIGLIAFVAYFYNALNGNPLSQLLAERGTQRYLEEHFPGKDYYAEKVGYNFKFTNYYAHIRSRSSIDTQFTVYLDFFGRVERDTYDDVTNLFVTEMRLDDEYRKLTDTVFDGPDFPYGENIGYGELMIASRELIADPNFRDCPDYAMAQEDLIFDGVYDIRELGAKCGHLVVYVESEELTMEKAAEVMLDIRATFDRVGIPFRAMDFVLQLPMPEDGPWPDEQINVSHFPYEDIVEEGLVDRVQKAHDELTAYYAEQDAKNLK